jgi:hypothetical protein
MAAAGNRAVSRLVRSLQRDDYTQTVTDVEHTGITRLEVHGLKYGVDGFASKYGDKPKDVGHEREKTKESPSHMAVVLMPDKLDLTQPVQVVLHFHGWVFRNVDPYAGYLVAGKGGGVKEGTVRDVHQERWEQQIASLKGQGAQVVAILAQGRGKAEFGSFPTFEYIRDVLKKSGVTDLDTLAESANYSVVLSGHSGGGSTKVVPMLGQGDAETADRGHLKTQTEDKTEKRIINKLQPVDLVALYEGLNGDYDVLGVINWVKAQLTRLQSELKTNRAQALAATPVFRGYYGKRRGNSYADPYRWLACVINDEIQSRIDPADRDEVSDRFRIIEVTPPSGAAAGAEVAHEEVISRSLADALLAARDPKRDRAQAVVPGDAECKRLKSEAAQREKDREEARKKKKAQDDAAKGKG